MSVLLPVPGSSRTSPLLQNIDIADKRGVARPPHHPADWASVRRACGLIREGLRSGPKTGHLGCIWCIKAPGFAAGPRQFADESAPTTPRYRGQAKRRPSPTSSGRLGFGPEGVASRLGFGPEGVGVDLSAKGCEAAPKQTTLVVSGAPRRLVLLPVPGSSRTSPLLQNIDIADKRSVARPPHQPADWASARRACGLVREGL
ncbi:hypothetical protein CFBP6411_04590 [Pseudomonas syringae group genomosp. 3]|uniref:Uncharacterized protein n=1 Tax=Pseudomonas syringae group genomosp. 3 TaxID=251701 RepID=A0A2K4WJ71_9PSED|nr:hypothetical protein CFBP6411_04590 [Pseudomonas syringae group genomosp. 3]